MSIQKKSVQYIKSHVTGFQRLQRFSCHTINVNGPICPEHFCWLAFWLTPTAEADMLPAWHVGWDYVTWSEIRHRQGIFHAWRCLPAENDREEICWCHIHISPTSHKSYIFRYIMLTIYGWMNNFYSCMWQQGHFSDSSIKIIKVIDKLKMKTNPTYESPADSKRGSSSRLQMSYHVLECASL